MSAPNLAILIIDDDLPTLELYGRELAREYCVVACDNATDAAAVLIPEKVAAVVLEPAVADGYGWQVLELLHASSQHVPVIVCSALDERRRGLQMGAAAYLVKPVSPAVLLHAVRQVLAQT